MQFMLSQRWSQHKITGAENKLSRQVADTEKANGSVTQLCGFENVIVTIIFSCWKSWLSSSGMVGDTVQLPVFFLGNGTCLVPLRILSHRQDRKCSHILPVKLTNSKVWMMQTSEWCIMACKIINWRNWPLWSFCKIWAPNQRHQTWTKLQRLAEQGGEGPGSFVANLPEVFMQSLAAFSQPPSLSCLSLSFSLSSFLDFFFLCLSSPIQTSVSFDGEKFHLAELGRGRDIEDLLNSTPSLIQRPLLHIQEWLLTFASSQQGSTNQST